MAGNERNAPEALSPRYPRISPSILTLPLMTRFCRMEGLALKRSWVDERERCVRFPDTTRAVQGDRRRGSQFDRGAADPQNVSSCVSGDRGDGHFVGVIAVLDRVCAAARLIDVTPHTLRHTFASIAGELGFSELTIAALLGHAARGVTQRYVHIDEALRMAADRIAGEIASLLGDARKKEEGSSSGLSRERCERFSTNIHPTDQSGTAFARRNGSSNSDACSTRSGVRWPGRRRGTTLDGAND